MDVNDFMARLTANAAPSGKTQKTFGERRYLEKISLNFPGNFGSYQLFPVNSAVLDYPFVTLSGTREVCIPRRRVKQDGTEETYSVWIKLLPKTAYVMKDLTGRITSSLTAEDESVLDAAYAAWDQINEEINRDMVTDEQKKVAYETKMKLIRKRNYTIFNGFCLNKWDMNNPKVPVRNNFSGLFISTASAFSANLKADVDQNSLMYGGSVDFVNEIYSSAKTGRTGSLFMTINRPAGQQGYDISFKHNFGVSQLSTVSIPDADFELMTDPLETFLGWQARRDDETPLGQRRLFNAGLIREAISFMTRQLAAIRSAKQSNSDVISAIEATNAAAVAEATPTTTVTTNDPMLKEEVAGETYEVNTERLAEQNTAPFQTPPAARMDPVSGVPVTSAGAPSGATAGSAPFTQPSFGNPFATPAAGTNDGMPF